MSAPASTRQAWLIGASHGMGRELALQLADQGWRLTLSARGEDALHEVARGCAARVLPLDATDRAAVRQAAISVFADCAPELVRIGMPVTVRFVPRGDLVLPLFAPDSSPTRNPEPQGENP